MKKLLLSALLASVLLLPCEAQTVSLEGKDYEVETNTDRLIGPGIRHTRYRVPQFPLNINVLTIDLNNPYNRIETTTANERSRGTEGLVNAGKRQSAKSHRAVAGANANFWVVGSQPEGDVYTGIARNASIRNGKMVVESNQHRDQWDGGTKRTGVVALSYDKTAYIDYCTSAITVTSDRIGTMDVHQCNKGVHDDELCMYNSFYGPDTQFLPLAVSDNGHYSKANGGDATEVILDLVDGQGWDSGRDIDFEVVEVRTNVGKGTLGQHDLALVGRGDNRQKIAALQPGDKVTLKYTWTYNPGKDNEVTPLVEQAVGPNALVMRGGELTKHNTNETYNSQVYSRTGYGCSEDGKTVYIIVIDKSTDPVWGRSAGCSTTVMCEFARWLGCSYMANFDAGGSAEMMVNGAIENRTTEGTPRAVANGWLVYSIAPEEADDFNTVAALAFDETVVEAPIYGRFTPKVIAYNRYGSVLDYDYRDFTLSCDAEVGTCQGNTFIACGTPCTGKITATSGDASVTTDIEVKNAQLSLRLKNIHLDLHRSYPLEITGTVGNNVYTYDPAYVIWTIENGDIAQVDANGVLKALAEGSTTLTATLGTFSDTAVITVEEAGAAELDIDNLGDWTGKGTSGISNVQFNGSTLTFTYAAPRNPYAAMTGTSSFYSLPDEICLQFNASLPLTKVTADMRCHMVTKLNEVSVAPDGDEAFAANTDHTVSLPLDGLLGHDDIATYPVSLSFIRFYPTVSADHKGDHAISVKRLWAKYNNFSGVDNVSLGDNGTSVSPNPVAAGANFTVSGNAIESVEIFTAGGVAVDNYPAGGASALTVAAPHTPGAYVVRVATKTSASSSILIVK